MNFGSVCVRCKSPTSLIVHTIYGRGFCSECFKWIEKFNIKEKDIKAMAFMFVSRTALPQLSRGAIGKSSAAVHSNGQITLSATASKVLGDTPLIAVGWDKDNRMLVIAAATPKIIKSLPNGEKDCYPWKTNKKSKTGFFAASGLLQFLITDYDYKASGNQQFEVTENEKDKIVSFKVPVGTLTPKPVVKRAKKVKNLQTINGGLTPETPIPSPVPDSELSLSL